MSYQEWRRKIKPEKKIRNYQHIDVPIDLNNSKDFNKIVYIIQNIKTHQFLPFIKRVETVLRFRKNKEGMTQRSLKVRPIMYASHVDSHIYSYYNFVLLAKYENYLNTLGINDNVIAYRKIEINETKKGKSNIHYAKEVFDHIKTRDESVVITQDIEGFFDTVNHTILKNKVCKVVGVNKLDEVLFKVFKSLTRYRYIEYIDFNNEKLKRVIKDNKYSIYKALNGVFKENQSNKGIPQGSPISGLLANIYLVDFDKDIHEKFPDVFYRRYSDDLVFICSKDQQKTVLEFINNKIKESKLKINAKKSFISYIKKINDNLLCEEVTDGLHKKLGRNYVDYLGLEFDGARILLRKNTIQKLKYKQTIKIKKQVLNTIKQERRKPKKNRKVATKARGDYLKKAVGIIDNLGISNQVLKVTRHRNKVRVQALKKLRP